MGRATILFADDELAVRRVIREHLRSQDYDVVVAENGVQALELAAQVQPDVILLDIEMPGIDGYGVLAALQARADIAHVPVIFLTGRTSVEDVTDGLSRGAHDYLCKPFDGAELLARVAAALRVKRLEDELRRRNAELDVVSRTDVLTGLYNRRHLEESLRQMTSQARRYGHPFSLVMFDIDRFKDINDEHGHMAGDDVLRTIARRIQSSIRESDVIGRWGGEEFLALLPMTELDGARTFAERIRAMIDWAEVVIDGVGTVHVTTSAGCASGADIGELLLRADEALYAAKKAGRNAVRSA
jgi:two-component system, cell cycle response regulator